MRIGVCTAMGLEDPLDLGLGRMDLYVRIGFDFVELPTDRLMRLDDAAFAEAAARVADQAIPCLACNNFFQPEIALTGPNPSESAFLRYTEKALSRCHRLGAKKIIIGSGGARSAPPGFPLEKAQAQLEEKLVTLCGMAAERDIQVILEHLNRFESNLVTSFSESADIVRRLNQKNLRTILDTHHFFIGNEDLSLLRANADVIGHIHYARVLRRLLPREEDIPDMEALLTAIRDSGFADTMSAEAFMTESHEGHRMALRMMRDLIRDGRGFRLGDPMTAK